MAAVNALSTCSGSLCRTRPHTAGTGPNPAQLKPQMAALVLALAQAAKANAAAQAQRNQQACWQLCRVFNGSPHWRKPSKPRKQHQRQPHRRSNDAIAEADYRPLVKIQRQLTLRRGARRARVSRITHRSLVSGAAILSIRQVARRPYQGTLIIVNVDRARSATNEGPERFNVVIWVSLVGSLSLTGRQFAVNT